MNKTTGYTGQSVLSNAAVTLEQVTEAYNLKKACRMVASNKGAPGTYGLSVKEYAAQRASQGYEELISKIENGKYRPQPVKRIYVLKENGEQERQIITTVEDMVVQQAAASVLSNFYKSIFSDNSFGYRKGRGCRDANRRAHKYVSEGYEWMIDLSISNFFDTVNHSKLLQVMSKEIKDGRVISLIHRFMRAPVSEEGCVSHKTTIGIMHGGPMIPVLAGILLNECDQMMDNAGIKFVRYADDLMIFCKSREAAQRALNRVTKFLEGKLFLKVNQEKTKILNYTQDTQLPYFSFGRS